MEKQMSLLLTLPRAGNASGCNRTHVGDGSGTNLFNCKFCNRLQQARDLQALNGVYIKK